jgi:hypothetical protein
VGPNLRVMVLNSREVDLQNLQWNPVLARMCVRSVRSVRPKTPAKWAFLTLLTDLTEKMGYWEMDDQIPNGLKSLSVCQVRQEAYQPYQEAYHPPVSIEPLRRYFPQRRRLGPKAPITRSPFARGVSLIPSGADFCQRWKMVIAVVAPGLMATPLQQKSGKCLVG